MEQTGQKKKKLVVVTGSNEFVNIFCDRMYQDDHFLYGYRGDELVAMFMIGTFDRAYINEVKE